MLLRFESSNDENIISCHNQASKHLTLSVQSTNWLLAQDPLCRKLALLAKFWTQTVPFDKLVYGHSYIFELLAVLAFNNCEGKDSLTKGFQEFLAMCTGLKGDQDQIF